MNEEKSVPTEPWYEEFRRVPFQRDWLPAELHRYVDCQAARFGVPEDFVAITAVAQLAGICAENDHIETTAGSTLNLPINVIVAVPQMPGVAQALADVNTMLQAIQQERLDDASKLDRKRIEEMRRTPHFLLPAYATGPVNGDPRNTGDARMQVLRIAQQPMFCLESPGSRELRAGFAGSFDRTLLCTFTTGMLLQRLTAARPDRESQRLAALLARLVEGAQIELPSRDEPCRVVQPRFGMLATTSRSELDAAITCDRPDVQSLVRHSILLAFEDSTMPVSIDPNTIKAAGKFFKQTVINMLHSRRSPGRGGFDQNREFEATLDTWNRFLKQVADRTPEHLLPHIQPFGDLPLKLTSLYLAITTVDHAQNYKVVKIAIEIAKWLLARTLICAADAYAASRRAATLDDKEVMLAKIVEFGPIDFWKLRRRFKFQNRELHQPVLEALIEEGRVRLNEHGKLVAA